jgi:hypothetical protein
LSANWISRWALAIICGSSSLTSSMQIRCKLNAGNCRFRRRLCAEDTRVVRYQFIPYHKLEIFSKVLCQQFRVSAPR